MKEILTQNFLVGIFAPDSDICAVAVELAPSPLPSSVLQKDVFESLFFCTTSCLSPPALRHCSWKSSSSQICQICCHFIAPLHLYLTTVFFCPDVHQQSACYGLTPGDCKGIALFNCVGTEQTQTVIKRLPLRVLMKWIDFLELFHSESLKIS